MPTLDAADSVCRFTVASLCELVPGSSPDVWARITPQLIEAGVLRKRGRGFFGRPSAIQAALLGELPRKARAAR